MATIIVVDTNPADRRAYSTLLGNFGFRMLEAENGAQALELARKELPDLIITDILMPNMDGFTFVRRLRAEPLLMGTPVIFHTSNYDETEIHRLARASGVVHILRKPAEPQAVLRAVNESLKNPTTPARLPQTGQLQREHLQLLADKLYEKVSELEDANERLRNLSLVDGLTGLNNRRGFMILATSLLKFARRAEYTSSLIYIDLDSLKYINDTFGHAGGDAALASFARILNATFRESDIIARLGGDEFVVLIVDASHSDLANMQTRLQRGVDEYNRQVEREHALSFSLGSIMADAESTISMEEFLAQADEAMYKHKQSRKRVK
ncbi:MAG: Sensor histidine kinase RcsC [Anaerolineales bacterium]|nr:Sensor histidine kinase RcsC [Anaerolineales bacterium]